MSATSRWRRERARLRSALRSIERGESEEALAELGQVEYDAFENWDDSLAGECGFARYELAGGRTRAADVVRQLLERRYRSCV